MAKQAKAREADWILSQGQPVYAVAHAKATVRGDSTVDADLTRLEEQVNGAGSFTVTNVIVNVDAWQEDDDGVRAVIPVTGATQSTVPLVCVNPDDQAVALQCGLKPHCAAEQGTVTIYAQMIPKDVLSLTILAMFSQTAEKDIEVSAPEAPTITYYKMPAATRDTLGGVRIGDNIDIAEDGTISVPKTTAGCKHVLSGVVGEGSHHIHDEECMKDLIASPDEVEDALNRALGIDAAPME